MECYITDYSEQIISKTKVCDHLIFTFLNVLFYRVEGFLLTDLHLGICPAGDLDYHVAIWGTNIVLGGFDDSGHDEYLDKFIWVET